MDRLSEEEQVFPEFIAALVDAAEQNSTPLGICMAAYDFVLHNSYYFYDTAYLEVGFTDDQSRFAGMSGMYTPPAANPRRAGCDAPTFIESILAAHTFTTADTPQAQLEALGIPTQYVFSDDLTGDGRDDWLIWTPLLKVDPILFVSEDDAYHVSRPAINDDPPDGEYNQIVAWILPNGSAALVNIDVATEFTIPLRLDVAGPITCPTTGDYPPAVRLPVPGALRIWQIVESEAVEIFSAPLCEVVATDAVFSGPQNATTLHAWTFNHQGSLGYVPAVYTWDAEQETFILKAERGDDSQDDLSESVPYVDTLLDPASQLRYAVLDLRNALLHGENFTDALHNVEALLNDATIEDTTLRTQARYYRALTLESLDRPDEALIEYVTIYEAAPDSAWGMLAALHLEPVAP